jgi:glutamate formiminotransferase/formiminotetrahydrofolate cyclodeaminase
MDAFALPKESAEEKAVRSRAIEEATKYAAEVPLKVMETAFRSYELLSDMADKGNPASISDVGVGALATRACTEGAALNVRINLGQLKDGKFKIELHEKIGKISADSDAQFNAIIQIVEAKLSKS